jgi:transcriptional regulator with GAF, ATPase, and Fis domain
MGKNLMPPVMFPAHAESGNGSTFERLLTDMSTVFINLSVDRIDSKIEELQGLMCDALALDRSSLFQASEDDPETLVLTHIHRPPESYVPPDRIVVNDLWPWSLSQVMSGKTVVISKMADLPAEADRDREVFDRYGTKSIVGVPLSAGKGPVFGLLTFVESRHEQVWTKETVQQFELVAQIFANALIRRRSGLALKKMEEALRKRLEEIKTLKDRFKQENICLKQEIKSLFSHSKIVGQSPGMKKIRALVAQVAPTDSTVIILGETGTGKTLMARAIHDISARKKRPLVTVNCAAMPPSLIESELFGREKGAYTGASIQMTGRFELADKSTLFLDEIGELPLAAQSKLLQVLEHGRFERLGSSRTLSVDVRVIAATNRDLAREVTDKNFRKDLYYRLNVFPVLIPPLRERREDIPLMVWEFVREFQQKMGKSIDSISERTMVALQSYHWPGNVRELRNIIENAMIRTRGNRLAVDLPGHPVPDALPVSRLDDMERDHIIRALALSGWQVAGKQGAAVTLGLKRTTLYSKMKKLGIERPRQ